MNKVPFKFDNRFTNEKKKFRVFYFKQNRINIRKLAIFENNCNIRYIKITTLIKTFSQ